MRSPDRRGEKLHQRGISSVSRLWSDYTQKREEGGNQFLCPFLRRARKRIIDFHPFQMAVYFSFFVIVFNKVFKTVSLVSFYCLRLLVACFN